MSLKQKQVTVGSGILLSFFFTAGIGYIFYFVVRWTLPQEDFFIDRWFFAFKWLIWPIITLWLGITVCAVQRFFSSAIDPIEGKESRSLKINSEYVSDTVSQLLLLFLAVLLLSTYMPLKNLGIIPTVCLGFSLGRVAYWIGYHLSVAYRSFGAIMTDISTIAPLGFLTVHILINNFIR